MPNAIDIVSRAMRKLGVLASGQLPTDDELNDAIEVLKDIFSRLISEGAFGELEDKIATTGDYTAEEFTRVYRSDIDTDSIELPELVTDEDTGEIRAPRNGAIIAIADEYTSQFVHYIYDGDLKDWVAVETMESTSPVPLASRDASGLACMLALELADEYGQPVGEMTAMSAARWHSNIIMDWSRAAKIIPRPENYY